MEAGELDKLAPSVKTVLVALLTVHHEKDTVNVVEQWKSVLNNRPDGWDLLERMDCPAPVVAKLLFDWLTHLKSPVVRVQDFHLIDVSSAANVIEAMEPLETILSKPFKEAIFCEYNYELHSTVFRTRKREKHYAARGSLYWFYAIRNRYTKSNNE
ncbi:unnamed protein product [Echinostoma caproni]|uniref:Rx_N domain-containing protein n=1 Tax=Echinostoma caproni TaxID=27848 RepID=A0A183ATV5_9TREM|nr:unnamed protein product [Echinostoma caproni]